MDEEQKIESASKVYVEGGHAYRQHCGGDTVDEYDIHEFAECVICGYQPCIMCTRDYREKLCVRRETDMTLEGLDY